MYVMLFGAIVGLLVYCVRQDIEKGVMQQYIDDLKSKRPMFIHVGKGTYIDVRKIIGFNLKDNVFTLFFNGGNVETSNLPDDVVEEIKNKICEFVVDD